MSPHIKMQWTGIRKDSGRGSICGWFTKTGKRDRPVASFCDNTIVPDCHYFRGKIGSKLHIAQHNLSDNFLEIIAATQKLQNSS